MCLQMKPFLGNFERHQFISKKVSPFGGFLFQYLVVLKTNQLSFEICENIFII